MTVPVASVIVRCTGCGGGGGGGGALTGAGAGAGSAGGGTFWLIVDSAGAALLRRSCRWRSRAGAGAGAGSAGAGSGVELAVVAAGWTSRLLTTVLTPGTAPASLPARAREAGSAAVPLRVTTPSFTAVWIFWPASALSACSFAWTLVVTCWSLGAAAEAGCLLQPAATISKTATHARETRDVFIEKSSYQTGPVIAKGVFWSHVRREGGLADSQWYQRGTVPSKPASG